MTSLDWMGLNAERIGGVHCLFPDHSIQTSLADHSKKPRQGLIQNILNGRILRHCMPG
ncbi:hypothetical protein IFHNHDMJ_01598 [Synechococcus sp. CBW1107]|nr:hypothetical protein IFHNHDMJ_01598 [Synechococcus sp. CBW1107]